VRALVAAALALLGAGCELPESSLAITIEPEATELRGDKIVYQASGAFMVRVTAVTDAGDVDTNLRSLAAQLAIKTDTGEISGESETTLVRSATDRHVFLGSGSLTWPQGGAVTVAARVAGIEASRQLMIDTPEIALVVARPQPDTGTSSVGLAFCVVSSARAGSVALHLESAAFTGTADTDRTAALIRGSCPIADANIATHAPPELAIESYAALSLTTRSTRPAIAAVLTSPIAGAPPLDTLDAATFPVVVPPPVASLSFVSLPSTALVGAVITARVQATTGPAGTGKPVKGVVVTFSASASVTFVPPMLATDDLGVAETSFVMPNVGGGSLIVGASGAQRQTSATIATGP